METAQKNNAYEFKKIQVLGYTTDFQQCECCGRTNLHGTMSILDIESGVILHFGTTCAVNANKYDNLEALKQAKKEVSKEIRYVNELRGFANRVTRKMKIVTKKEACIADFMKFMEVRANRLKRFNWEAYQD